MLLMLKIAGLWLLVNSSEYCPDLHLSFEINGKLYTLSRYKICRTDVYAGFSVAFREAHFPSLHASRTHSGLFYTYYTDMRVSVVIAETL